LNGGGPDSPGDGVNQNTRALGRFQQSSFPKSQICGEVVDRKRSAFFATPVRRHRPKKNRAGGNYFGERSPLQVAHHAVTVSGASSAELPAGNQRRSGRARISATGGHGIGKVDAGGFNPHQFFPATGNRFRNIAQFKDLGSAEAADYHGFHNLESSNFSGTLGFALRYILLAIADAPEGGAGSPFIS
jgi:hypothetical protein